jgi:hypothetical protein
MKLSEHIIIAASVVVITIFPVTQIILLTLNGGLSYVFALPFDATTKTGVVEQTSLILNIVLTLLAIVAYFKFEKTWIVIVSTFFIMFSGQTLMLFVSDEFNGGDNYFLGWLTVAGIPTLTLAIVLTVKYFANKKAGT